MQYELFYLIGASKEAEKDEIIKEAEGIVTSSEGVFSEKTTVEKRRLSYAVKHETHGIYVARRFELEKMENLPKIIKKLNLNSKILRFIISRADELPELLSKEERISAAAKREERPKAAVKETPRTEKPKEPEAKPEPETKKDKETSEEDIDKKLEEILNI